MSRETPKYNSEVKQVFKLFGDLGYQIYLVGGCVRDLLLNQKPHDFDFATNATPWQMRAIAEAAGYKVIPTGEQYGTMTLEVGGGHYEVTTFRGEDTYSDGRRPDAVHFSKTIYEDLVRRDFTINAMAMDAEGNITDLFGGQKDLRLGIIRTVGDPEQRFTEDGLRILRALRFAYKLKFRLSDTIEGFIPSHLDLLSHVSAERIREELFQILSFLTDYEDNPKEVLFKVLSHVMRGQEITAGLFELQSLQERLAQLCCGLSQDDCTQFLKNILKASNATITKTVHTIYVLRRMEEAHTWKDVHMITLSCLNRVSEECFMAALSLLPLHSLSHKYTAEQWHSAWARIKAKGYPIHVTDLQVDGNDLSTVGFVGREIGETLNSLLCWVWEAGAEFNDRTELIGQASSFYKDRDNLSEWVDWVEADGTTITRCSQCLEDAPFVAERYDGKCRPFYSRYCPWCGRRMKYRGKYI